MTASEKGKKSSVKTLDCIKLSLGGSFGFV